MFLVATEGDHWRLVVPFERIVELKTDSSHGVCSAIYEGGGQLRELRLEADLPKLANDIIGGSNNRSVVLRALAPLPPATDRHRGPALRSKVD